MAEKSIDVGVKKEQAKATNVMFEGKNIHSSPLDGKLLCSYSEKLCKQRRLNGYAFCIRHVLEDKNAPFKQCQFVAKYNGHQCTNPIPFAEDRIYCNSHLQVLGIVPKKVRRKKPGEGVESEVNSSSSISESKGRTDVLTTPALTNMPSIPPQLFPFRLKKPKNQPQKRAYTNIPAIEELRESRRKWQKDRADLFKIYGIDSSDDDSSSEGDEMPWQQMWLSSDSDIDYDALRRENNCLEADIRTAKISRLSTQLRRQLHQLRRTLRSRRNRYKDLLASGSVLVKAVHSNSSACVDSLLENSKKSRKARPRPAKCLTKTCAFSQDDVQCNKKAFPYTKFCKDHIMNDSKQVLYAQCTAKWPGGLQCSVPVFDVIHERPLCDEHARKAKFQEAQAQAQAAAAAAAKTCPATIKPPAKKPRRKPQPKAPLPQKAPKVPKKPASRKPAAPRSNKARVTKTPNNSLRPVGLDNSFSPDNSSDMLSPDISLSLSSDYSHGSAPSPMSPALDDFQQYDSSMFESEQRDEMLLSGLEHEGSEHGILSDNFPVVSNGSSSIKGLYPGKSKNCGVGHSVPASVITHTPGLLNSGAFLGATQSGKGLGDSRTKASPLNSKSKTNKGSKPRDTKKLPNASNASSHSMASILSPSIHPNNIKQENNKIKELALNKDPMFSPPHGLLGSNDLKSHSNGVNSDHLHSPPMTMDAILSPTQRSWSAIVSNPSPASSSFTSPLNSTQSGLSRLVSPPFSPPSMSPHISPHTTLGSVFTFDRPTHFQQSHITSPTLSPASPSFLQGQIKSTGPPYQRHNDLDHSDDPFLFPVDRDQSLFGGPFNQNHDASLGDLRLR
ncbi:uncharacterized protein LOC144660154 isoform X3 [Oculina patagonica]